MKRKDKRGRYGDGCVYQQKGRSIWWLTWYEDELRPDGRRERVKKYRSSKSTDRQFAQRLLRAQLQKIGGRRLTAVDPEKVSYDDLRSNFLTHCVAKGLRSLKLDADGNATLATLPRLDKYFSGWRAAEITVADLKSFRADCREAGLSDARCNRYMATLRAIFNQARKDELITRTEIPGYFPTVAEPNEARGAIFIEDKWYAPLRKALKEPLRSAFTLAYKTSMRVHEMLRLKWRHVDAKSRIVTLPGDITKTGASRLVPLPLDFKLRPGKPDDLVFPLGNYRWQWYKACVKIKAGHWEEMAKGRKRYVGILLRHCRHAAIRNMSDDGMDLTRIKALSGHKTDSMVHRYNIGREGDVERARQVIERGHKKRQSRLTNVN